MAVLRKWQLLIGVLIINIYQLQRIVMDSLPLKINLIIKITTRIFFLSPKESLQFKQGSVQSLQTYVTTGILNRLPQWPFAKIVCAIKTSQRKTTLPRAQCQKQRLVCVWRRFQCKTEIGSSRRIQKNRTNWTAQQYQDKILNLWMFLRHCQPLQAWEVSNTLWIKYININFPMFSFWGGETLLLYSKFPIQFRLATPTKHFRENQLQNFWFFLNQYRQTPGLC